MTAERLFLVAAFALAAGAAAEGGENEPRTWTEEKCVRYRAAWEGLLASRGRAGLGHDFVERHDAFVAGGCTGEANVCPRSPQEFDAANRLVALAMNAGMSATFLPFSCKR